MKDFICEDETDYEVWKYPMRLNRPHMIVPEPEADITTRRYGRKYKIFTFKEMPTYDKRLRVEDVIVHTLKFDHGAAKNISVRNKDSIDKHYFEQRIKTENMEKPAMMISLDTDFGFELKADNVLRYKAFILDNNPPLGGGVV